MYDAARGAVEATSLFVANAGGVARIDWQKVQRGEPDHIYDWYGKTLQKIFEFRASMEKCALYLGDSGRERVKGVWDELFHVFQDSGKDLNRDSQQIDKLYNGVEEIRKLVAKDFLSGKGFLKHIFFGIFR